MKYKLLGGISFAALIGIYFLSPALAATTIEVSPFNTNGWLFFQENPTGTGSFVNGPGTPPMGNGSAQLTVDSNGRMILSHGGYAGVKLADITKLEYWTYKIVGGSFIAPSLQFDFDNDVTDGDNTWRGRLVYEPYFTHTVNNGVWQMWNPLDNAVGGNWWGSPNTSSTLDEECPQSNPCTWSEVLQKFPLGGIRETNGFIHFKSGGPWSEGFSGNVDAFTIGINNEDTTYNFELIPTEPTSTPTMTPTPTSTPTPTPTGLPIPTACSEIEFAGSPIIGTNADEQINGTNGNDLIFALGGSDVVNGKGGNDCIVGGTGSDALRGDGGNDVILGEEGSDSLIGGGGNDHLYGGAGSDALKGEGGSDTLVGDDGSDSANGGGSTDTCNAEAEVQCEL